MPDLKYLEGKKFCVVFIKTEDDKPDGAMQLRCMHGRASIDHRGALSVQASGGGFAVPASAYHRVLPSDGTDILEDAEYFVMVRVSGMDL
ncbi:MAG: hypothetical protein ACI8W8_004735 [Rhodothermales bacterium]|jgi:hypothetical protein